MTTINIISHDYFLKKEEELLFKSLELLQIAINSDMFKQKVLNFDYNGKREFNYNQGKTNAEIYELFMSGKEATNGVADYKIDLRLSVSDNCPRDTVGTTYGQKRTETYRCKLNDMNESQYAGHIAHEYCHYLGFAHTRHDNPTRKYTVPYAIGYILRDLVGAIHLELSAKDLANIKAITKLVRKNRMK